MSSAARRLKAVMTIGDTRIFFSTIDPEGMCGPDPDKVTGDQIPDHPL
jgi:hypothetical protein